LQPHIRRFKSTVGCTINPTRPGQVHVHFLDIIGRIDEATKCLDENRPGDLFFRHIPTFMTPFLRLEAALNDAHWVEKVRKSSRLSGHSITGRFFLLPERHGVEADLVRVLADE
jgi:hypothetical protein